MVLPCLSTNVSLPLPDPIHSLLQVPEQQQDQCVGTGVSGPPRVHAAGAQTEQEPDWPGPGTGLPAARPHPAVSTRHTGFIYAVVKTALTQEAGLGSLLLKGKGE